MVHSKAKWKAAALVAALCLVASQAQAMSHKMKARADLLDAAGKKVGTAKLSEQKDGVKVTLEVSGLSPGRHGFHIHETGTCTPPDFKSAGPHFNPFQKQHGSDNPAGKHAGDFPNLDVKKDGTARATAVAAGATLKEGPASLFKPGGTAIVIHAAPDDYKSDPAGNAGDRVACGVIIKE